MGSSPSRAWTQFLPQSVPAPPLPLLLLLFLLRVASQLRPEPEKGAGRPNLPAPPALPGPEGARAHTRTRIPPRSRTRAHTTTQAPRRRTHTKIHARTGHARVHIGAHLDSRVPPSCALPLRPRRALPGRESRVWAVALLGDWREPEPPRGRRPHHGLSPSPPTESVRPGSARTARHARGHSGRGHARTYTCGHALPRRRRSLSVSPARSPGLPRSGGGGDGGGWVARATCSSWTLPTARAPGVRRREGTWVSRRRARGVRVERSGPGKSARARRANWTLIWRLFSCLEWKPGLN